MLFKHEHVLKELRKNGRQGTRVIPQEGSEPPFDLIAIKQIHT
jgi:hypothetical protein